MNILTVIIAIMLLSLGKYVREKVNNIENEIVMIKKQIEKEEQNTEKPKE